MSPSSLVCMCDTRIAAQSPTFAESFVKLGIIPGDGGASLLQRLIGPTKAAELTFTGDAIDADLDPFDHLAQSLAGFVPGLAVSRGSQDLIEQPVEQFPDKEVAQLLDDPRKLMLQILDAPKSDLKDKSPVLTVHYAINTGIVWHPISETTCPLSFGVGASPPD
jgi:hypothetical protein